MTVEAWLRLADDLSWNGVGPKFRAVERVVMEFWCCGDNTNASLRECDDAVAARVAAMQSSCRRFLNSIFIF